MCTECALARPASTPPPRGPARPRPDARPAGRTVTERWTVYGYDPLILSTAAGWLVWRTHVAVQDTRALIVHMWRYGHFPLPSCAPDARGVRHSCRPRTRGPAMPDENDVTRIGRGPANGWTPTQPPATVGFPNPDNPRPDRRGLLAGMAALGVTVLVGALVGAAYLLWPHSGPKAQTVNVPAAATSSPATKSMLGKVTMPRYNSPRSPYDSPNWKMTSLGCEGVGGFDDMAPGASVTVYDGSGTIVGSGGLVFGIRHGDTCEWDFGINDLPDVPFYQVEVSHRGKITVANEDLGRVALSLGG